MPVGDRRLTGLPTEIDRLAVAARRKVDQSEIDIFDDAAEQFNTMDEPVNFEFAFAESRRRKRRTHAGQSRHTRLLGVMQRRVGFKKFDRQLATFRQEFVDQWRKLRDQRVRAFG
jgi:hypothetical protein